MNTSRPFTILPAAAAGWLLFTVTLCPVEGHGQQPRGPRNRPAARPTPTPAIIPAASPSSEVQESSPPSDAPADAPIIETIIDASDGATFASRERIAVFSGNVRVNDPRFQLSCDKLTVFLNKSAAPDGAAAPTPASLATPAPSEKDNPPGGSGGGGIDHVVAEGHVIIIQKRAPTKPGEEEKTSIGRGNKGTFDNRTGDMVLTGMPEIEQNGSSHAATSADTVMTIHKDSSLDTKGPSKTILQQHKGGGTGIEMPGVPAGPANNPGAKPKKNRTGAAGSPPATPLQN